MRVNTRMWSAVVEVSKNQQIAANAGPESQVIAQVHVPIVWRVALRSSLGALSPALSQVSATLYGSGGTVDVPVGVVDGQEFTATGLALYLPPLSVALGERVWLCVAPATWPAWLQPVTREKSCGCVARTSFRWSALARWC